MSIVSTRIQLILTCGNYPHKNWYRRRVTCNHQASSNLRGKFDSYSTMEAIFMYKLLLSFGLATVIGLNLAQADENTTKSTVDQKQNGASSHQGDISIEQALVNKLRKANDVEIDLAKLALQQSDNDEVKKLAQQLIADHQSMNQNLEKVHEAAKHQDADKKTDDHVYSSVMIPVEFCKLGERACENNLKLTKEMLSDYKGQDFNMAFLGQQCVAHTMALSELRAIETEGPQALKETANEGAKKVDEHLKAIKKLAKKLEDDRKPSN